MTALPSEIVDAFVDFVATSSRPSLPTCSLICRQWLPRSRYHYFSSVKLTRTRSKDTVKPFLHLIASPLVTFVTSVRRVEVHHRPSYGTPVLSAGDVIAALVGYGLQPNRIVLDCHFNQIGMRAMGRNLLESITHLDLLLYGEVQLERTFDYLATFPSLHSFSLGLQTAHVGNQIGRIVFESPISEIPPASLHELNTRHDELFHGLDIIGFPTAQFTSLILRDMWPSQHIIEYFTLSTTLASLVSLTLDNPILVLHRRWDLGRLRALRHLEIHKPARNAVIALLIALDIVPGTQHTLSMPLRIETIDLVMYELGETDNNGPQRWDILDGLLAGSGSRDVWPHLRRLRVCGREDASIPAETVRVVRKEMPLCVAQGLLIIS